MHSNIQTFLSLGTIVLRLKSIPVKANSSVIMLYEIEKLLLKRIERPSGRRVQMAMTLITLKALYSSPVHF